MNVSSSSLTTVKHVVNIQARRKLFPQGLGGGGGLVLPISSDGNDRMGAKIKTTKILRASNKTEKNPWTKI